MTEEPARRAVEIERPTPNYPLMLVGGFVFLCVAGAIVLSASSDAWSIMVLLSFALAGAFAYIYFNSVRKPLGLQHRLDWQPTPTEVQKQTIALEVEGIAASLQLDPWQTTELFSAYAVAEDLALRRVQQEHSSPMIRHLQVGGAPFDALIIQPDELICV